MSGVTDPGNVFDWVSFWKDVKEYQERWKLHIFDIAEMAEISVKNGRGCVRDSAKWSRPMSIYSVYKIAQVCDLDLNRYNIFKPNLL